MRVWLTAFFRKREVIYIVRLWQDFSAKFANICAIFEIGKCQIFCRFFKCETIGKNDVGILKSFSITWLWLKRMRVSTLGNNAGDKGASTTNNVCDDVGDWCNGCGDGEYSSDRCAQLASN